MNYGKDMTKKMRFKVYWLKCQNQKQPHNVDIKFPVRRMFGIHANTVNTSIKNVFPTYIAIKDA